MLNLRRFLTAFLFMLPLLTTGCGVSTTSLSGTVSFENKPLPGGTLIVIASDGAAYNATIDNEGKFSFDSIPVGEAKVGVVGTNTLVEGKTAPPGRGSGDVSRGGGGGISAPAPKTGNSVKPVPDAYRDPLTSNLNVVIKKGEKLDIVVP